MTNLRFWVSVRPKWSPVPTYLSRRHTFMVTGECLFVSLDHILDNNVY